MAACSALGCSRAAVARGWCGKHYQAWKVHGDPLGSRPKRPDFAGCRRKDSYVIHQIDKVPKLAHVLVAERALGRSLPAGAVVHHVDEDPSNNAPSNLVICPDQSYHMLLHCRMRALAGCGHADWRKCGICKTYDAPENLAFRAAGKVYHRACDAERARQYRANLKQPKE